MVESGVVLPAGFSAGLRVFIVDDDVNILSTLELMLFKCGYKVTVSDHALKALELLRENKGGYDIVITDVNMPEMDGFKLLEIVVIEMNLPVIVLSIDFDFQSVMKSIKYGAVDYLVKPVQLEELRLIWKHVAIIFHHHEKKNVNESKSKDVHNSQFSKRSKNGARKRVEYDDTDSEEDFSQKKARVSWTPELHAKFINALNQLGIDKAVPKKILDIMDIPGLTRENVASHLQKYRKNLKRDTVEFNKHVFDNVGIRGYNGSTLSMAFNRSNPNICRNNHISPSYLPNQPSNSSHAPIPRSWLPHTRQQNNFYPQYSMNSLGSQLGTQLLRMTTNTYLMNRSTQLSAYQSLYSSMNRLDHHAQSSANSWINDGHAKSNLVSQPESIVDQQATNNVRLTNNLDDKNNFNEFASLFTCQSVGQQKQHVCCGSGANAELKINFNSMDVQIFDFKDQNGSNATDLVIFPEESHSTEMIENTFEFVDLDYPEELHVILMEFQL